MDTTFQENMNYEVNRLASFDTWPKWAVKRPIELADKGFYYCGKEDQVKCYSCNRIIGNWSLDDDVEEEHKKLYPNCLIVQKLADDNKKLGTGYLNCYNQLKVMSTDDLETGSLLVESLGTGIEKNKCGASDNIDEVDILMKQMSSQRKETENPGKEQHAKQHPEPVAEVNPDLLRYEAYRRQTFDGKWPETSFTSPADLAKAGFYYVGPGDTVKCAFCKGRLLNWKATDNPMSEHRRHYENCPFVQGNNVGNVSVEGIEHEGKSSLPAEQEKKQSACESLGVMVDKPKYPEFAIETVREDSFKHWPKNSVISPTELAKAGFFYVGHADNVRCFFCGEGLSNWEQGDEPWTEHARWFPRCGFVKLNKGDNFAEADEWLQRPDVKTVIGMGFSADSVRRLTEQKLKTTGEGFKNVDSLLDAVLNEKDSTSAEVPEAKQSGSSRRKKKNKNRKKKSQGSGPALLEASGVGSSFFATKSGGKDGDNEEEMPGIEKLLSNPSSLEDEEVNKMVEEYQRLKEERTCKICMDAKSCVVFLPCGHIVCCSGCAPALRNCPICRAYIKGSVRAFIP